jgi:multidrug resistance efflux pump
MGSATRQELEDAQAVTTAAESDVAEATGRLKVLLRSQPEEIEATMARLDRLETEQRYLEEQLSLLDIVTPVSGIVATPTPQLRAMERQLVPRGALIAKVYDFRTVTAQIVVGEAEIADVAVGQPVILKARAYPDAQFKGTVTAIATSAEGSAAGTPSATSAGLSTSSRSPSQMFVVTTRIDNGSLLLKPGMTGQAKVLGGQRRVAELINRRVARTFKVQFWSWW